MSKDYAPKANIEHHYHIEELIEGQKKRSEDRNYHRDKEKERAERETLIKEAKVREMVDFHCSDCYEDFPALAQMQVETDWTNPTQRIAFYKMKHTCGKWCVRHVTDKWSDAFWSRSVIVAIERGRYFNDLVQPSQEGFNLLYGKGK